MGRHSELRTPEGAAHSAIPATPPIETKPVEISDAAETVVLPRVSVREYRLPKPVLDPMTRISSRIGERKRAFVGFGSAVLLVVVAVAGMGLKNGAEAQALATQSRVLTAVQEVESPQTPSSLRAQPSASEISRLEESRAIAQSISPICLDVEDGANSLVSALANREERVYFPMAEDSYEITSPFGPRIDPITWQPSMHYGVDLAGKIGTPYYAVADGVVLEVGADGIGTNSIVVEHTVAGHKFTVLYSHSYDSQILVAKGDKVKAGQHIGSVGDQGYATGPHLHFEIHDGTQEDPAVEPLQFMKDLNAITYDLHCSVEQAG